MRQESTQELLALKQSKVVQSQQRILSLLQQIQHDLTPHEKQQILRSHEDERLHLDVLRYQKSDKR